MSQNHPHASRVRLYEFLATLAHGYLWLGARLLGGRLECGPVGEVPEAPDANGANPY